MTSLNSLTSPASSEPPRRRLSARQAETVRRLTAATVEELREVSYDGLTVRNVARRAGVATATAYTYFTSKEHLVTEVFWRRLEALSPTSRGATRSPAERVGDALADLALLVADEPELAAACTSAMLSRDPEVSLLRDRIGRTFHRHLVDALASDDVEVDPVVVRTLELAVAGALVQAGTGHIAYDDLPDQLRQVATLVVPEMSA